MLKLRKIRPLDPLAAFPRLRNVIRRRPTEAGPEVDLLPDRKPETVIAWLEQHASARGVAPT